MIARASAENERRPVLRAGTLDRTRLRDALGRLVAETSFSAAAVRLQTEFGKWDAAARFAAFVEERT
ncbi:MAG TPA: hypothetical protein VK989_01250 [Polyangia bacterium]|jgi:hypothetical protein|nr:hypothetical protein [Polyangia bacterium]